MRRQLFAGIFIIAGGTAASAQITMSARTVGNGVSVFNGAFTIPPGTDVSTGFQESRSGAGGLSGGTGSLQFAQTAGSLRADLRGSASTSSFSPSSSNAAVRVTYSSGTPMLVDVSLSIVSEFAPFCAAGQAQLASGSASAQLIGFAPLTNDHCNVTLFGPPCTFTFSPMILDSNGLTFELTTSAAASSFSRCFQQRADFACAIEVRPSAVVEAYGPPCGAELTVQTSFATPGRFDIGIQDAGAALGVLLIGNDRIAAPFLGCTLLTTPVASVPFTLDPFGAFQFRAGLPRGPFALQAVTLEGQLLHFSQGLAAGI